MNKPTISVDFDGVLHSYSSGWNGARNIPDPPVVGAIEWLVSMLPHFEIVISSARSSQWGGRHAMKRWIRKSAAEWFIGRGASARDHAEWALTCEVMTAIGFDPGMDPLEEEADLFGRRLVSRLKFPRTKPSAMLYIDDRAHCFDGTWPSAETIRGFVPWNKTRKTAGP